MIAVRSLQEYRAMISAKKVEIGHFVKNSVQMSSAMDQYIAERRLFARTFREAVSIDPELAGELPSTKGTL